MNFLTKHLKLILILALALFIRILIPLASYVAHNDVTVFSADDTGSYVQPARELLAKGTFTDNGAPVLLRTPGYPLFLIQGILLHAIELITISLQIIIGTLTVFLVHQLALRVFENLRIALAAALLFALEPLAIAFCGLLLTETIFSFFFVLFLYCFFIFLKKSSWLHCLASAVLLSITTYIRPVSLYLNIAIFVFGLIYFIFKRNKKLVIMLLAFTAASASLDGVWILRNGLTSGYFAFSSVSDVNLYSYQSAAVLAATGKKSYVDMTELLDKKAEQYQKENHLTDAQTLEYMRKEGTHVLLGHPFEYGIIHLKGMATVVFTPGAVEILKLLKLYPHRGGLIGGIADKGLMTVVGEVMRDNPLFFWTLIVLFLQLISYYFLAIGHLFSKRRALFPFMIFLLLVSAYFLAVSGGPHAVDRFRHPLMPIVCLFAGSGWVFLKDKISALTSRVFKRKEKIGDKAE